LKTLDFQGCFLRLHVFYTILSKTCIARSSSRGYRCAYVFHVISILECPNRLAISCMLMPSFANREACEWRKSCMRSVFCFAKTEYFTLRFWMVLSRSGL